MILSVCRWVHPGSLGSLGFAMGVVGFIGGFWVQWCSPCGSLGSSWVVGFTRVRPGDCWVHMVVVRFTQVRPGGSWVHAGSLGSLGFALGVVGLIIELTQPPGMN